MTFKESSGMIQVAGTHQNLLSSMWWSFKDKNLFLKLLLLLPVLFYSVICVFFIVFFYIASVIDIIPYIVAKIANWIKSKADNLGHQNFGFWGTLFLPPFVLLMGILMLFVIILPKAFGIINES